MDDLKPTQEALEAANAFLSGACYPDDYRPSKLALAFDAFRQPVPQPSEVSTEVDAALRRALFNSSEIVQPTASTGEAMVGLLTKAVGDIAAALSMGGNDRLIKRWTVPYVAAINAYDDTPSARITGDKDRENPVEGASTGEELVEELARAISAHYMMTADKTGQHLPDDMWQQVVPLVQSIIPVISRETTSAHARGKAEERAAVVAWLLKQATCGCGREDCIADNYPNGYANGIATAQHTEREGEKP